MNVALKRCPTADSELRFGSAFMIHSQFAGEGTSGPRRDAASRLRQIEKRTAGVPIGGDSPPFVKPPLELELMLWKTEPGHK